MIYKFREVKIADIEGNAIEFDLAKNIAKIMYKNTVNLDLVPIARELYEKWEVDLRDSEIVEVRNLVVKAHFAAFIKKEVIDFIDETKRKKLN